MDEEFWGRKTINSVQYHELYRTSRELSGRTLVVEVWR
jgi:hypothetical protein